MSRSQQVMPSDDTQALTAEERGTRRREYLRRYRAAHREELREYHAEHTRQWRIRHREKYLAGHRKDNQDRKRPCVSCGEPCRGRPPVPRCRKCTDLYYRDDKNWRNKKGGETAAGYRRFHIGGREGRHAFEHRLIWEATHGPLPKGWHVHHLNGEKADNRLCNLFPMPNVAHFKLHRLITGGAFSLRQAAEEARQMMAGKAPALAEVRKALKVQYRGDAGKQASYERNLLKPGWAGTMTPVERTYVCQALFKETRKLLEATPKLEREQSAQAQSGDG